MKFPAIPHFWWVPLSGLLTMAAPAVDQTAPVGFYSMNLTVGDQAVGISLVNPARFGGIIGSVSGNRLNLNQTPALPAGMVEAGKAYYAEIVSGPAGPLDVFAGQRFEVDVAQTLSSGAITVDPASKCSTSPVVPPLAGYRMELRAHVTLDQVFPKERLFGSTNFAEADQVQFFDGKGFEICYIYRRGTQSQWTRLTEFSTQDDRVIRPGEGVIFKRSSRSPGAITLRMSGVARTGPFLEALTPGHNFVSSGFPVNTSFTQRHAWPAAYQNGDRIKVPQSQGFTTYRLYSQGTAPSQNAWVTLGDPNFVSMNEAAVFDYRHAAFLQLKTGSASQRYAAPYPH